MVNVITSSAPTAQQEFTMNNYQKRRITIRARAHAAARQGVPGNPYRRADDRGLYAAAYRFELGRMENEQTQTDPDNTSSIPVDK
jgi:hypothetical protein